MLDEGTRISFRPSEWWTQSANAAAKRKPLTATVRSCNRRGTSCVIELRPGETQTINLNRVEYEVIADGDEEEASQSSLERDDQGLRTKEGNSQDLRPEAPSSQVQGSEDVEEEEQAEDDLGSGDSGTSSGQPALDGFDDVTGKSVDAFCDAARGPADFERPSPTLAGLARLASKALFDFSAAVKTANKAPGALTELYVDGFDAEQIWGQLDAHSSLALRQLRKRLKKLPTDMRLIDAETEAMLDELMGGGHLDAEAALEEEEAAQDPAEAFEETSEGDFDREEREKPKQLVSKARGQKSRDDQTELLPTEDEFFRLDDMEHFVQAAEEAEMMAKAREAEKKTASNEEEEDEDDDQGGSDMEGLDPAALGVDYDDSSDLEDADAASLEGEEEESNSDEEDAELARLLESATEMAGRRLSSRPKQARADVDEGDIMYEDFFGPRRQSGRRGPDEGGIPRSDQLDAEGLSDFEDDGLAEEAEDGFEEFGDEDDADAPNSDEGGNLSHLDQVAEEALPAPEGAEKLSRHEQRLQKVAERARMLEAENVGKKEWFMQGEAAAASRPLNSALEIDLDFERAVQPPPQPTEETTASLEDLIKRRITDHRFDDPQRKAPPPDDLQRELAELDDKKSAKGLGEVYEEEFVRAKTGNVLEDKDEKTRSEAKTLLKTLFGKLDALSHFHFAPKPIVEDLTVRREVPALAMEEVAPLIVSEASRLRPEEVYRAPKKTALVAEEELTHADRRKRRASKKRAFKNHKAQKDAEKRQKGISVDGVGNIIGRKSDSLETAAVAAEKKARKKQKKRSLDEPGSAQKVKFTKSAAVFGKIQDERDAKKQKVASERKLKSSSFKL